MSRSRKALSEGVLSVTDLAILLSLSQPTVRRLVDAGEFAGAYKLPGTLERRIPAPTILKYLEKNNIPIPLSLQKHLDAYQKTFGVTR